VGENRNRVLTPGERWKVFLQKLRRRLGGRGFLCDTCRYDYEAACAHRERPNATVCPDHRKR
jgi:hypothetical protein